MPRSDKHHWAAPGAALQICQNQQYILSSIDVHLRSAVSRTLFLNVGLVVKSEPGGPQASIAVLIADRTFAKIMQVVPKCDPFIGGSPGTYRIELSIELPPLIPGYYYSDFWIGHHNAETFDWIRQAITVEIVDTPNPTGTYHLDNGSIAPILTVDVSKISTEHE